MKELIKQGKNILENADISDAMTDSWLLAEYVFGMTKAAFYMSPDMTVTKEQAVRFLTMVNKRAEKIPLQHITGCQEFMGIHFFVNRDVLIPRQDTELLVEKTIEYIHKEQKKLSVLDMCTGSGCIAISIDKLCRNVEVTAVDLSEKALDVAKRNNAYNKTNVQFIHSDLFDNVVNQYDIIVSNPPYIKTEEIANLMTEVKEHEPFMALDGDKDGLKFYQKICENIKKYLKPEGRIFFEIGYDQGKTVPEIMRQFGFHNIEVIKDLSGNDRVVTARRE